MIKLDIWLIKMIHLYFKYFVAHRESSLEWFCIYFHWFFLRNWAQSLYWFSTNVKEIFVIFFWFSNKIRELFYFWYLIFKNQYETKHLSARFHTILWFLSCIFIRKSQSMWHEMHWPKIFSRPSIIFILSPPLFSS